MREVVQLSQRQENLLNTTHDKRRPADAVLAEDQFALLQGTGQVTERLAAIGRRTMSLAQGLNATIGYALRNMGKAAEHLGQRESQQAQKPQGEAMRYLNETVLLLRESLENLAQAQSPSGFGEAMQKMLGLSEQQGQLNQASQQALTQAQQQGPGQGGQEFQRLLGRIGAEQTRLLQQLDEIGRSLRGHRGAQQRVEEIEKEIREVLADLSRRRLDQRTLQKQERIYQRMLDASRSLHSRGFKEKRQGKIGADQPYAGPTALPSDLGQVPDRWRQALRRALEGPYPDEYHALLKRYYEQVYQDAQEREAP
jgi:chromosome segregation ATPase